MVSKLWEKEQVKDTTKLASVILKDFLQINLKNREGCVLCAMICNRCVTESLRVSWSEETRGLHVEVAGSAVDRANWVDPWPCMSLKRAPHCLALVLFTELFLLASQWTPEDHVSCLWLMPCYKGLLAHWRVPPRRPRTSYGSFCGLQFPSLSLSNMRIPPRGFARIRRHSRSETPRREIQ